MRKQLGMADGYPVWHMLCERGRFRTLCTVVTRLDCLANAALSTAASPSCHIRDNFARRFCHFGALAMHACIKPANGQRCQNLPYLHTPLYCVWQPQPRCLHALFSWTAVPDEFSLTIQRLATQMPYQAIKPQPFSSCTQK